MAEILETPSNIVSIINSLTDPDLKDYANDLYNAATRNSDQVFANHADDYAAVAYAVLFSETKEKFHLIVDRFQGRVSNKPCYVKALTDCMERGIEAEILSLHNPNEESEGFKVLLEYQKKGKVKIRVATESSVEVIQESMKKSLLNFKETHNLGVFDRNKYRLEYLPSEFKAFVSMNNIQLAAKHYQTFSSAFTLAEDYISN